MLFTIIIPTFHNFNYLKLTIESILENSLYDHQIIIHLNGKDHLSENYLKENNIEYTKSDINIGLCSGVNRASKLSKTDFIVYAHDDMFFLPRWDFYIFNEIKSIKHKYFFLSGTQIGPIKYKKKMANHIYFDAGENLLNFKKDKLLQNYENLKFYDLQGSHWAPHIVHIDIWKKIGGFSEEFNPGFGSDPDLNMKLWKIGVRIFKGIDKSRIYHFGSVTTRKNNRIIRNKANKTFLMKWGISISFFIKYYLRRGEKFYKPLDKVNFNFIFLIEYMICKIKFTAYKLKVIK
jgi:glycosyltransferase involved in cell wall biosynthesis